MFVQRVAFDRDGDAHELAAGLRQLGHLCQLPLVAAGDVHMHRRGRRALQDTELSGVPIAAGTIVHLMIAGANRDPAQFPNRRPGRVCFIVTA